MTLLRDSPDDLFALLPAAAAANNIRSLAFVEKEYWALEALRSLQEPLSIKDAPAVVFKGGTSLSRALKLTQRFSDDIDVMLHYGGELGAGGRNNQILKPLIARVVADLGGEHELQESTEGVKRNVRISYPTSQPAGTHSVGVLVEMTIRSSKSLLPGTERASIQSYVGKYLDDIGQNEFEDTQPFDALVLSPVRTLIEKLSLLHGRALAWAESGENPTDVGRHYYDVHRLLSSERVVQELNELGPEGFTDICVAMEQATVEMRLTPPARPLDSYAQSPAFAVSDEYRNALDRELDLAVGLVFDEMPSTDECCQLVVSNAESLSFL